MSAEFPFVGCRKRKLDSKKQLSAKEQSMIKFATIVITNLVFFCVAVSAQIDGYIGEWKSSTGESRIERVRISESEGNLSVRVWGDCRTGKCDWGAQTATRYFPTAISSEVSGISAVYLREKILGNRYLILTLLPNKLLQVRQMTTYDADVPLPSWMTLNTFVKTSATILAAPEMTAPQADANLTAGDFSLELKWQPVAGAEYYLVDIEYYDAAAKIWRRIIANKSSREPRLAFTFNGKYWGRWRVRAVAGENGEVSAWRRFNFTNVKP
jgi:hypothetical protein